MGRRKARSGARIFVAFFIALGVFLSSALASVGVSYPGKHCKTAAVQKVSFLIAVQDSNGATVLKPIDRAPKPGELAFKQCHCVKADVDKDTQNLSSSVAVIWFVPDSIQFDIDPQCPKLACASELPSMLAHQPQPPIPPPDQA